MPAKTSQTHVEAEVIALKMLEFIASEEARIEAFLNLSGTPPAELSKLARDPQFLAGVYDFLLADQSLLLLFAESEAVKPESLMRARRFLPGATDD